MIVRTAHADLNPHPHQHPEQPPALAAFIYSGSVNEHKRKKKREGGEGGRCSGLSGRGHCNTFHTFDEVFPLICSCIYKKGL